MVFLSHSFVGTRVLKVLVVPIGENSLFDEHFDLVSRMKFLPKEDLSHSNSMLSKSQAFRNFQWDEGNFVFDYVRYDVASGSHEVNDYIDSSQRILIVLGLINHPELGGSSHDMENELKFFSRNHPFIAIRRLIVFNYDYNLTVDTLNNKSIGDLPILRVLSDDSDSLIILPSESDEKGKGLVKDSLALVSAIENRLKVMLAVVAVKLFESLQREMMSCEDARATKTFPFWLLTATKRSRVIVSKEGSDVTSVSSMGASSGHGTGGMILTKTVMSGRLRKFMGDLCLQVCSPIDALCHYLAAIAECRATADLLWLAGALEGYAASVLTFLNQTSDSGLLEEHLGRELKTLKPLNGSTIIPLKNKDQFRMSLSLSSTRPAAKPVEDVEEDLIEENMEEKALRFAQERCVEALTIYASNTAYSCLEASCSLRLATMYEELGLVTSSVPSDRLSKISEFVMRAISIPGLKPAQRIEVTAQGAIVFRRAGLRRKYGLLMYMASLMSAENDDPQTGHLLMQKSIAQYGTNFHKSDSHHIKKKESKIDLDLIDSLSKNDPKNRIKDALESSEEKDRFDEDNKFHCSESKGKCDEMDRKSSWTSMRLQLLAHSTYIARESGDFSSATSSLCLMIKIMNELELRQQQQLIAWSHIGKTDLEEEVEERLEVRNPYFVVVGDDNQSSIENNSVHDRESMKSSVLSDIARLLSNPKGRRTLTTEIIEYRLRQKDNIQTQSDPSLLSARNVSKLGSSIPLRPQSPQSPNGGTSDMTKKRQTNQIAGSLRAGNRRGPTGTSVVTVADEEYGSN